MGKSILTIVSEICSHECSFCAHREGCEREDWNNPMIKCRPLSKCGSDEKCPMMQFNAEKLPPCSHTPLAYRLTVDDTWDVCERCEYGYSLYAETPMEDGFMKHCIDCPCYSIREAISENEAEARMS